MTLKLIKYETDVIEDVEFGSCELCYSTGTAVEQWFTFEHIETGGTLQVPGFEWNWGDLFEVDINNIPHFAEWLQTQTDLTLEDVKNYSQLQFLLDERYIEEGNE